MSDADLIQGTDEWRQARCGSLGASRVPDAIARTKTGWGASRANVMADLVAERLTGIPSDSYVSPAMLRGTETEPYARAAYCFRTNYEVREVGIIRHPTIKNTHASPDGLIGTDGMVEIKCPNIATHIDTLKGASIDGRYITQMQWQMAVTGRQWVDFCSFDPRLPEAMRLFVKRVHRSDERIAEFEALVSDFLAEVDSTVAFLTARYQQPSNLLAAG